MVEVVWNDASELPSGWSKEIEHGDEPQLALSVGFLLRKTKDHIVLAMDLDASGFHNTRSQIPRGMVKQINILRKADKGKNAVA